MIGCIVRYRMHRRTELRLFLDVCRHRIGLRTAALEQFMKDGGSSFGPECKRQTALAIFDQLRTRSSDKAGT